MSLLGFEGWDHLTNGANIIAKSFTTGFGGISGGIWSRLATGIENLLPGQLGGLALDLNGGNEVQELQLPTLTYPRWIGGIRIQAGVIGSNSDVIRFDDQSTAQVGLSINSSGKMFLWRGSPSTILATGTFTFVNGTYYYLEFDVTINNTTGAFKTVIYDSTGLTSTTDINVTGVNTRNSSNNQVNGIRLNASGNSGNCMLLYDDFYLIDPSTGSPTAALGPVHVETLFPTADDSVTWTPLTGANWQEVSEINMDGNTSYNVAPVAPLQDTFLHGALANVPQSIHAVAVTNAAGKSTLTVVSQQTTLKSGGTTQQGAAHEPEGGTVYTYLYLRDIYQTDPNTGLAWSTQGINSSAIGYHRIS